MVANTAPPALSLLSPAIRGAKVIEDSITQGGITGFLRFESAFSMLSHTAAGEDAFDAWEDLLRVSRECVLNYNPFAREYIQPALAFPDIKISVLPGIEMIGPWQTAPPPHLFIIAQAHPLWQVAFTVAWRHNFESDNPEETALFQALRKCGVFNPELMKHVFFRAYVVHLHEGYPSSGEVLRLSENQRRMAYTTLTARSNELGIADDTYFSWARFGRFRRQAMGDILKEYWRRVFFPVGIFVENYPLQHMQNFQTQSTPLRSQRDYVNIEDIEQAL